jgi:hypothetical protein
MCDISQKDRLSRIDFDTNFSSRTDSGGTLLPPSSGAGANVLRAVGSIRGRITYASLSLDKDIHFDGTKLSILSELLTRHLVYVSYLRVFSGIATAANRRVSIVTAQPVTSLLAVGTVVRPFSGSTKQHRTDATMTSYD